MAAVCVPWRPGDFHRNAAWEYVRAFWSDSPVFIGDTDGPFNRAAARNAAAALTDSDILIFADADTIGDHDKDYLSQIDVTADWLQEHGVSLVFVPYTVGISTSEIITRVR